MANSDNVVRAGLTPKFKDVERLLEMLDYTSMQGDSLRFPPTQSLDAVPEGVHLLSFIPPVSEFAVDVILVRPGGSSWNRLMNSLFVMGFFGLLV